jgi:threonine aldolase
VNDLLSDNSAGLCPEALAALTAEAAGPADAYGADDATARATARIRDLLGADVEVFFVATGTAANTLTMAALTDRWETLLCEEYAHLAVDESTGPEILGGGTRVVTVPCEGHKLTPDALRARDATIPRGVHHPAPGVVTVSNASEHGEVYTPDELAALGTTAHELGYRFHVDGARFANAVAALGCDPRELTTHLDALTFGGAKNGLALGEAIVLFPGDHQARAAARVPHLRKATGHLLSKHRFLTAPFAAALTDGAWLRHAGHANTLARKLSDGLAAVGLPPRFPTDANMVFVSLPDHVADGLRGRGWRFHMPGHPDWRMARFVTSFDTDPALIDRLVADAGDVAQAR